MDKDTNLDIKLVIYVIIFCAVFASLFVVVSGDFHWIEGWIISGFFLLQLLQRILYLRFKNPDLLKERMLRNNPTNQKSWDKFFLPVFFITIMTWLVIMPLDRRFHWTNNFPLEIKAVGFLFALISFYFVSKSFADNTFASPMVRIQEDRNQHVVSTGVYAIVRHPMYLGGILSYIGVPMFLNSIPGLILGVFLSILFILRIFGEEKMLEEGLEGYKDYKKKVKYRLIPFIW